ncbi:MAG TPA: hypothetical protein PKA37_04325 [Planctomycetota bacterium]|nr:hypothetical protein [Planctomycetota bacterium]
MNDQSEIPFEPTDALWDPSRGSAAFSDGAPPLGAVLLRLDDRLDVLRHWAATLSGREQDQSLHRAEQQGRRTRILLILSMVIVFAPLVIALILLYPSVF